MSAKRKMSVGLLAAAALALLVVPVSAASQKKTLRTNRVVIEYQAAVGDEHREIEDALKKRRVLERVAEILSPFKLPRPLKLVTTPCDGDVNAYYENDEIKVCYEYLATILKRVSDKEPPKGTTRRNLLIGAMVDVFFHETGHAVFDMLEIPVLGREEDAADQFSAYLMLQFAKSDALQLIVGAAFWFVAEQRESAPPGLEDYSGEHGLPAQRFFNYMCLAYGSDPKFFAAVIEKAMLSKDRAQWCPGEYRQMERAFRRLILPHVDQQALAKVRAKRWFEFDPVK